MHSITKVPIDFDQLGKACRALLGSSPASVEVLDDGWFNAAYGLRFDSGLSAVLKAAPPNEVEVMTYEKGIIHAEHEVMTLLQGALPLPRMLAADLDGKHLGRSFIIMERLEGTALDKVADKLPSSALGDLRRALGRIARTMHAFEGESYGLIKGARRKDWPGTFTQLMLDVVNDGRRKNIDLPYENCLSLLDETQQHLADVTRPCLVHWDLWDGNVLVDSESGALRGIIDFERALYGDPLIEFNALALNDDVKAGYGEFDFESESAVARLRIYSIYLFLIMSIEGKYRGFIDESSTVWGREKLQEALTGQQKTS